MVQPVKGPAIAQGITPVPASLPDPISVANQILNQNGFGEGAGNKVTPLLRERAGVSFLTFTSEGIIPLELKDNLGNTINQIRNATRLGVAHAKNFESGGFRVTESSI